MPIYARGSNGYHRITYIPVGNGKEVEFVVDKDGRYVYRKYRMTWDMVRDIVRSGGGVQNFPVGTIMYDTVDPSGTAFQVVDHDVHFNPDLIEQGYTHSMTLCELYADDAVTFDEPEAILYVETVIQPDTYSFTINNVAYYFTSNVSVPVGSQLVLTGTSSSITISAYAGPNPQSNLTPISGLDNITVTRGTPPDGAVMLFSAFDQAVGTSVYGQVNADYRRRMGSNNYAQSGVRQYLNSNSAANAWWTPQTMFDRPYTARTIDGKLKKLDPNFVDMLTTPAIKVRTNNCFETPSLDGTVFALDTEYTISTDKLFLLSHTEVGSDETPTVGTTLAYFADGLSATRYKRTKSGLSAIWSLRSARHSFAYTNHAVQHMGSMGYRNPNDQSFIVTSCVIQ